MAIVIRPSSLPTFVDCQRRCAARTAPRMIEDMGYKLRDLPQRVGPAVGTATHAAVAHTMLNKIATGESANQTETEQAGLEALDETVSHGVEFDGITPNFNSAQKQVVRLYRVYRLHLESTIEPTEVEHRIERQTKRGNTLSGQPDVVDLGIRDTKTGVVHRVNMLQLGAYSLLKRAEGGDVRYLVEDYIQRVDIAKEQPVPMTFNYDLDVSERAAGRVILDIEERFARFEESQDEMEFIANPGSMLCSDRWCTAHSTDFCREHAGAK